MTLTPDSFECRTTTTSGCISRPGPLPDTPDPREPGRVRPEAGFDTLVKLVRTGIDLCTRARAAAARERRETRKQKRRPDPVPAVGRANDQGKEADTEHLALPERLEQAVALMKTAQAHLSAGKPEMQGIPYPQP